MTANLSLRHLHKKPAYNVSGATFGDVMTLFRDGLDTSEIASTLMMDEASVHRKLGVARTIERSMQARRAAA